MSEKRLADENYYRMPDGKVVGESVKGAVRGSLVISVGSEIPADVVITDGGDYSQDRSMAGFSDLLPDRALARALSTPSADGEPIKGIPPPQPGDRVTSVVGDGNARRSTGAGVAEASRKEKTTEMIAADLRDQGAESSARLIERQGETRVETFAPATASGAPALVEDTKTSTTVTEKTTTGARENNREKAKTQDKVVTTDKTADNTLVTGDGK